ncbi:helix-turn-helix domain-containing protein [Belnapia moabensis]|uniref:helix-turn-helix domain-containing protein n=1 Tax=Belnapia moabensis TaxID=365533 RepID=UPI000694DC6F|nr:helix-turn-helix transcriptional regulator [Belnapia moabensis]
MSHTARLPQFAMPRPADLAAAPRGPLHPRLKQARLEAGVTLAQMGRALGVSPQQILKYETGQNRLCASRLPSWAMTCGVTVDDLLGQGVEAPPGTLGEGVDSLVRAFISIADAGVRRALVETAKALAEADRQRRAGS